MLVGTMLYTDALIDLIEEAYSELWENATKLEGKLDFKPSDSNRTPMEMLVECSTVPGFLAPTIRNRELASMEGDHSYPELKTIEACRAHFESVKGDLYDAIKSFPQDKLKDKIETPWGTFTWMSFMAYAYWNPMYHVGQLGYIQLMHGDTSY
ncbi:MAG: hypothetical protein JNK63_02710 [Chthonomonas sp.]|nr:hypothetical protein [Chthonomonas sp.]